MEKIIRLSIENTTKIRQVEDSFCELYSHDKNNGAFEFEISKGTLTNENVVALFKFLRSGSYWKTTGTVEDNKIKFNFDTSLITQNEEVVCYIYLDKEERNSDIFRFRFKVNLSEIDKASQLPVKERFFANSMIVDRVDVLTKEDFDNAIAEISKGSKFLTEDKANERYALKGDIPNVSDFVSSTHLSDYALKTEIPSTETIVNKAVEKVEEKGYLTSHQSLAGYVTETQLEGKNYLTEHQDISKLATKEQLKKAFLDDEEQEKYAKKTELPQPYNDTDIKSRLTTLENRPQGSGNVDTSNFATKNGAPYVSSENMPLIGYLSQNSITRNTSNFGKLYSDTYGNHLVVSGREKTAKFEAILYTAASSLPDYYEPDFDFSESENIKFITTRNIHDYIPANVGNTIELDKRLKVLEAKQWEIHGRGMPNGVVTAPVGTTYVDEAVTNGALKWIKKTGTGNTGWEVLIGDTGWRTLPAVSKLGNSFVKVRRKNDTIFYQFGGLSWGWFGIVRRGGAGYQLQGSDRERNCYILGLNGVPQGFRSESSLIGGIYNDKGTPYGTWYLGGAGDSHMLRFQFTDPVPTDRDIGDIRVSSISYLTNDPWPQN